MKVWVVTDGSYSDYHIEGVFSTEALAEEFRDANFPHDGWVDEWKVDGRAGEIPRLVYEVRLETVAGAEEGRWAHKIPAQPGLRVPPDSKVADKTWCWGASFVSYDHALDLAMEARQEWLREQAAKA